MRIPTIIGMAALFAAAPVLAHPKLMSATPAPNATVAAPARAELRFSERLVPQFTGADLVMTGMPGMADHPPMKMPATAVVGRDGHTLVVTFAKPLPAGSYRIDYRVVSADTHRITGAYAFRVR